MSWDGTYDFPKLTLAKVTANPELAQSLQQSRTNILRYLGEVNDSISQINEEYSTKIKQLENLKKPWEEVLTHIEALLKIDNHNVNTQATTEVARSVSITDAAFNLLQQIHEPTHYKEITKKLQDDNVHVPGKNPSATLLSRISRDKRFKRAKKRGVYALSMWRLRDKRTKPRKKSKRT
jgi:Asp-tRNA(Asn)/Glu-tRNA(Gln) amidotransferase C subunit